jgi:hypothetical protein
MVCCVWRTETQPCTVGLECACVLTHLLQWDLSKHSIGVCVCVCVCESEDLIELLSSLLDVSVLCKK